MFDSNQFFGGERGFYPLNIEQSLRFNDDDSAYLSRTPATAGNRKTYTISVWVKLCNILTTGTIINARSAAPWAVLAFSTGDGVGSAHSLQFSVTAGSSPGVYTSGIFRDPSAWYHIVCAVDTTQATASDRVKIYVNGVLQTLVSGNYPTLNQDTQINSTIAHQIGNPSAYSNPSDFYLAEFHLTDGTAYDADAFGEFKSGVWVAKSPSVTYGTNGFYLDFANSADIGNDVSGEGNDWTPNNFTASDVVLDSPTDNFCVLNPLGTNDGSTFSNGNLQVTSASGASTTGTTFGMSSGKWYAEFVCTAKTSVNMYVGIVRADRFDGDNQGNEGNNIGYIYVNDISGSGRIYYPTGDEAYGAAWAVNDVIGIAFDADTRNVTFYKNGVSQGEYTRIASDYSGGTWMMVVGEGQGSATATFVAEFGQGGFTYTPPTGYLALSTANLPEPTISPADDASPSDYFDIDTYTGTGTTHERSALNFQPDWVWIKNRVNADNHYLYDVLRGATQTLHSDTTGAEFTSANALTSFDSDGFTIGSDGGVNRDTQAYVAWNWKANGSGVSNTDGTITSTVSANTTSGFSIVSWTGTGSSSTVGHGLNSTPELIINKNRSAAENWVVYSIAQPNGSQYLRLNQTSALVTDSSVFGAAPTSSVFTVGTNPEGNGNGNNHIAYCFHSVEGFSKFGSYTGNGSADGPFVYTGFRPAFVLIKVTNTADEWVIFDDARNTYNLTNLRLNPDQSSAESSTQGCDFLSNGFKLRTTGGNINGSGNGYIYMAFAENPFKYSNAR